MSDRLKLRTPEGPRLPITNEVEMSPHTQTPAPTGEIQSESAPDASPSARPTKGAETAAQSSSQELSTQHGQKALFGRRTYRYHGVHLQHILQPGGILERYVVIETARLRQLLGQPRRRPIESLTAHQEHFEFRTSELWELAEAQALPALQKIYAEANRFSQALREERKRPAGVARQLATAIEPVNSPGPARGILLHGQEGEDGEEYFLYVWDPQSLRLLKIRGVDLKRAWQQSQARLGETIEVVPRQTTSMSIEEERSGTHGQGRRTIHRRRARFDIHRVGSRAEILDERSNDARQRAG